MRSAAARHLSLARGHVAEAKALAALMLKGYRPLARRFSAVGGEIDLIVARGDTIAFVEVKARPEIELGSRRSARASAGASPAPPAPGFRATPGLWREPCAPTPSSSPPAAGRGMCRGRSSCTCEGRRMATGEWEWRMLSGR
jgi:Uncharacterised protein family UPF0102